MFFKVSRSRGKSRENGAISLALKKNRPISLAFHHPGITCQARAMTVPGQGEKTTEADVGKNLLNVHRSLFTGRRFSKFS